jgi:methionyl-tRNA formyltransferase
MALDKETGVSLQVMVRELDAGDIIGERRLELERHMTAAEVLERMKPLAADLLRMDLMDYLRGHLTPVRQDPSRVTFAPKIKKEEAALDFSQPAEILAAHVRGMTMGPGSFLRIHGKTVKIHRAEAVAGSARLGEIATIHRDSFDVGTARGLLRVFELQPESKGKMSVLDFLRGHALVAGENVSPL